MAWGGAWELFAVFPQPLELKPGEENPVQRHQTAPWWKTQTNLGGAEHPRAAPAKHQGTPTGFSGRGVPWDK